ncbi:hypothetical protein [Brevundimonas sp.]|jgi:hypothetical protein|uniref:hypothetical protein n=1 Tax=Brevundimonas sp. TaxID=1871086 RepID=UPI002E0DEFF8|nr:hypothetical protein [Brevundimonas sp.]
MPASQFPSGNSTIYRIDYRTGQKILIVEGRVDATASFNLDAAIRANIPIDEIWFNSPGGIAVEGPRMGKIIRDWGIPTRVPSGWWCVSACNFAFLGGPIRSVDEGGQYAVHMFSATRNDIETGRTERAIRERGQAGLAASLTEYEESSALLATDQNDFMIRMGVSRRLLSEVMYQQPAAGIRCLTQSEMRSYNVVNF